MKNNFLLSAYPHLAAIGIFLLLTLIFMWPIFQGKYLEQHDVIQAHGMFNEAKSHYDETGEVALWTNSMFGGMPTYQIWITYPHNLIEYPLIVLLDVLPRDSAVVFILLIGGYVLMLCCGISPWLAIVGAVAFTFASFNMVSLEAGHFNKVIAMGWMPAVIGGAILTLRGRLLWGAAVFAIFLALQLRSNHFQITYYTFLTIGVITIGYLIYYIRSNQAALFAKAAALLVFATILAAGTTASQLWTTYEYADETIRGKPSELTNIDNPNVQSKGLDIDYATRWSLGILESMTLIIPNFMGGASSGAVGADSNLAKAGIPQQYLSQSPLYWGSQPGTSGPVYFGASVIFLFVLSLTLMRHPLKWPILAACVLSLILAWGNNLQFFYEIFFYYFPMFNRFRTPTMMLVIPQTLVVLGGIFVFCEIVAGKYTKKEVWDKLKLSTLITAGVVILFGLIGSFMYDFKAPIDEQLLQNQWPVDALRADRKAMLQVDAFRSLVFILATAGVFWLFIYNKIKAPVFIGLVGVVILIDLWPVSRRYLNNDDFITKNQFLAIFAPSPVDQQILQDTDKPFRVINLATNTFNDAIPSYHHHNVGGYHAAKLRRYQEVIERQISKNNMDVFNMLNTRYFIVPGEGGQQTVQRNPEALGRVWFVDEYRVVANADEEMAALTDFDPASTAIVDQRFSDQLPAQQPAADESATIQQASYSPNRVTYTSSSSTDQIAVFSEIYYDEGRGWNAYVNGNPVPHFRVNYLLRGMVVPAGNNEIVFEFRPRSFHAGGTISLISSALLILGFIAVVVYELKFRHPVPEIVTEHPVQEKPKAKVKR